jgi:hypothetical protein
VERNAANAVRSDHRLFVFYFRANQHTLGTKTDHNTFGLSGGGLRIPVCGQRIVIARTRCWWRTSNRESRLRIPPDCQMRSPNNGLRRVPAMLPTNAAGSHTQPCTLPDAMPLKYAPMLQPYAMRAP